MIYNKLSVLSIQRPLDMWLKKLGLLFVYAKENAYHWEFWVISGEEF